MAFLVSVLVGARRFAHSALLRGDKALHALPGIERFPTDDTPQPVSKVTMENVRRLYQPPAEWQM